MQHLLYLFDERGFALSDNWYRSDFKWDRGALNPHLPFIVPKAGVVEMPGAYCPVARMWGNNYGHFIYQNIGQIALMEAHGFQGKYLIVHSKSNEQLLDLMGLDMQRIIWLQDLDWDTTYRFETLLVAVHNAFDRLTARACVDAASRAGETVLSRCASVLDQYPRRIFVKRIGSRRLLGVESILERYGFQTIVPEELSVEEQIRHYLAADIAIAPHGANAANSVFMRPGTALIETFGRDFVLPWNHETSMVKGVHYFPIVESPTFPFMRLEKNRDYSVNPTILESIIETAIELTELR